MTCGIYRLKFGTLSYIGQSVDIEYRFKKHIQKLKAGTSNYKVQRAYKDNGTP